METVYTDESNVACDGGEYNGHPRVYLDVAKKGHAICPYCSCEFVMKAPTKEDA